MECRGECIPEDTQPCPPAVSLQGEMPTLIIMIKGEEYFLMGGAHLSWPGDVLRVAMRATAAVYGLSENCT